MRKDLPSILITGGAGFLGRNLLKRMAQTQAKIVVVDNRGRVRDTALHSDTRAKELRDSSNNAEIIGIRADVRDEKKMSSIIRDQGVTTCIHLAGLTSIKESFERPDKILDANVNGTFRLLNACRQNGVKGFVFASSSAVYGEPKRLPVTEDERAQPISFYGASKIAGEAFLSAYSGFMDLTVSLRFFNIYGSIDNPSTPAVIQKFKERLEKGLPLLIRGDGRQTRDFVHVKDAVACILLAHNLTMNPPEKLLRSNIVVNVGTGTAVSISDLANRMLRITGHNNPLTFSKPIPGDIKHSCADTKKCEGILGFRAKVKLKDGLFSILNG